MKKLWNVSTLWNSIKHLPKYSGAIFHLYRFRTVGSPLGSLQFLANPWVRSFSSKKLVKPGNLLYIIPTSNNQWKRFNVLKFAMDVRQFSLEFLLELTASIIC